MAGFPPQFRNITQYLIYSDAYVTTFCISNRIVTKCDLNILSFICIILLREDALAYATHTSRRHGKISHDDGTANAEFSSLSEIRLWPFLLSHRAVRWSWEPKRGNEANPAQTSEKKWTKSSPYKGHGSFLSQIE
jgi:hypothetical protein